MIISLGSLALTTEPRREDTRDVAAMHIAGVASEHILKEMMDQAYDKFNLNIDNIQVNLLYLTTYSLTLSNFAKETKIVPNSSTCQMDIVFIDFVNQANRQLGGSFESGKNH